MNQLNRQSKPTYKDWLVNHLTETITSLHVAVVLAFSKNHHGITVHPKYSMTKKNIIVFCLPINLFDICHIEYCVEFFLEEYTLKKSGLGT